MFLLLSLGCFLGKENGVQKCHNKLIRESKVELFQYNIDPLTWSFSDLKSKSKLEQTNCYLLRVSSNIFKNTRNLFGSSKNPSRTFPVNCRKHRPSCRPQISLEPLSDLLDFLPESSLKFLQLLLTIILGWFCFQCLICLFPWMFWRWIVFTGKSMK